MKRPKKTKQPRGEEVPSDLSLELVVKENILREKEKFPPFIDEQKVVALIVHDKDRFVFFHDHLKPEYFRLRCGEEITRIIFNFYDKYGHPPGLEEVANEVDKFTKENPREPGNEYYEWLEKIVEPPDLTYTNDEVLNFIRKKAVLDVALELPEAMRSKKPTLEIIDKAIDDLEKIKKTGSPKFEETTLSDVEEEETKWFWKNKIPMGTVSLIVGYQGSTKSYFTMMLAAYVTRGCPLPEEHFNNVPAKGSVIILSAEDDPRKEIKKRIRVHGGDGSRVVHIGISKENYYMFNLKTDLKHLEDKIKELKDVKLIIIDPVAAYLGADYRFDSYRETHVRSVLAPVAELAKKHGLAIVGVMHLNKNEDASIINRVSGSGAFVGAARAVWLIVRNRDDRTLFHFVPIKNNYVDQPSRLSYRIKKDVIAFEKYEEGDLEPEELLSKDRRGESPIGEAKEFLLEIFKNDKERDTAEITDNARTDGIAIKTLKRAKKELRIRSKQVRVDGKNKWMWVFPDRLIGLVEKQENPEEGK